MTDKIMAHGVDVSGCFIELGSETTDRLEKMRKIKAYQEDKFCQGGCAIYQYDKIHELTQALDKIEEITNKKDILTRQIQRHLSNK